MKNAPFLMVFLFFTALPWLIIAYSLENLQGSLKASFEKLAQDVLEIGK
jgi:hypothetical protein